MPGFGVGGSGSLRTTVRSFPVPPPRGPTISTDLNEEPKPQALEGRAWRPPFNLAQIELAFPIPFALMAV